MVRKSALQQISVFDQPVTDQIRVRHFRSKPGTEWFPPNAHVGVEVAFVRRGQIEYRIGRKSICVAEGEAIVVPSGVRHRTRFSASSDVGSVWIQNSVIDGVSAALGTRLGNDAHVFSDASRIIDLYALIATEAKQRVAGSLLAIRNLTEVLAVHVCRSDSLPRRPSVVDHRIRRAIDRVEDDFASPLCVEDLAKCASMSRYHFSRRFRSEVGRSPYKFLLDTRVDRAAELLRSGASVSQAAIDVGFTDLGRFCRAFKARHGQKPSEVGQNLIA